MPIARQAEFTGPLPTTNTLASEHRKIVSYTYCLSLKTSLPLRVSAIFIHHSETLPECLTSAKRLYGRFQWWISPYNCGMCTAEHLLLPNTEWMLILYNLIFRTSPSTRHKDSLFWKSKKWDLVKQLCKDPIDRRPIVWFQMGLLTYNPHALSTLTEYANLRTPKRGTQTQQVYSLQGEYHCIRYHSRNAKKLYKANSWNKLQ